MSEIDTIHLLIAILGFTNAVYGILIVNLYLFPFRTPTENQCDSDR